MPPTTWPSAPTWIPVDQPYVGSPPTTGSALTTRTVPITWRASSAASSWPSAFSTGAAAFFAAASLTAESAPLPPPVPRSLPLPLPLPPPLGQLLPFRQLSPPGDGPNRANVQVAGACLVTRSTGPEPSFSVPTFHAVSSDRGVPVTPSASASRATSAAVTLAFPSVR